MRKISRFIILFGIISTLASCTSGNTDSSSPTEIVTTTTITTSTTVTEVTENEPSTQEPDYIVNTNTGKFHYPDCSSVDLMNEENKLYFNGDSDDLKSQGYSPCKRCNP